MKVRELKADEVEWVIEVEPEETDPVDHFDDMETVCHIRREIVAGNEWAWCAVTVKAVWRGFVGRDHLGGCSYKSREDFTADAYYRAMQHEALADLNQRVAKSAETLSEIEVPSPSAMREALRWMLALVDGGEEMPKPGDEVAEAMRAAIRNEVPS